jgi:hypothetical protein
MRHLLAANDALLTQFDDVLAPHCVLHTRTRDALTSHDVPLTSHDVLLTPNEDALTTENVPLSHNWVLLARRRAAEPPNRRAIIRHAGPAVRS